MRHGSTVACRIWTCLALVFFFFFFTPRPPFVVFPVLFFKRKNSMCQVYIINVFCVVNVLRSFIMTSVTVTFCILSSQTRRFFFFFQRELENWSNGATKLPYSWAADPFLLHWRAAEISDRPPACWYLIFFASVFWKLLTLQGRDWRVGGLRGKKCCFLEMLFPFLLSKPFEASQAFCPNLLYCVGSCNSGGRSPLQSFLCSFLVWERAKVMGFF